MENACIYCGIKSPLSKSDIVPDALTNAKIINPNVCKIKHNSKFSDDFEAKIIKELAFITNELDIKSSKSDNFQSYSQNIVIDGTEYNTKISSTSKLFKNNLILTSVDNNVKLGPVEKIKNIPNIEYREIDINDMVIERKIPINLEVFFCNEIYRLMAKIAFEWYCLKNDITEKMDCFLDVIKFIETGEDNSFVSIVDDEIVNGIFNNYEYGCHTIISYIAIDGSVNVFISFFGIVVYNVRLLPNVINEIHNNAIFSLLSIDAKQYHFVNQNIEQVEKDVSCSFENVSLSLFSVCIPKNMNDYSLKYKIDYILNYSKIQNMHCVKTPDKKCIDMVIQNIEKLLHCSALTIKSLKRFINDYNLLDNELQINPKGTDKKMLFLAYVLFKIGKSEFKIESKKDFYKLINSEFDDGFVITEDYTNNIRNELLEDESKYFVKQGATIINNLQG